MGGLLTIYVILILCALVTTLTSWANKHPVQVPILFLIIIEMVRLLPK